MDERSCFVCCFDYELPLRTPYILKCCSKTVCSKCLESFLVKNEQCPNCRKTLTQTSMSEFPLNLNIEEALKFEKDGNVLCQQCTLDSKEKAIKVCLSCGPICNQCYSSHLRMIVLKTHEISFIPVEKWSKKLDETLKASSQCEQHIDRITESFCKTCQKVVCEDCIAESHSTCKLSSIDHEFEETKIHLERELDDMDAQNIVEKHIDAMKDQEFQVENIDREIKALETHCSKMLISNFEAVRTAFQEKKKKLIENHQGREKKLTNMTQIHANLSDYVKEVGSIQNKRGVLKQFPLVQRQIDDLGKEINEVDEIEPIDYLTWIKNIFNELQLAANKNAVVDYALEVAENCDGFPSICNILRQYRHLNKEKAQLGESIEERLWYVENNNKDMFPRYKYHLNLVQKIVDHEERLDPEIITSELSKCMQCSITVLGKITEPYRKLFDPLIFKQLGENDPLNMETHRIAVLLADTFDVENRSLSEQRHLQSCSWCIIITANCDPERYRTLLSPNGVSNFSITSLDAKMVWDHLTSAMELPLIEYLEKKKQRPDIPKGVQDDVETVIRRLEKLSSFPVIQSKYKSTEIPNKIKDVLERFEKNIVRYGFCFDQFRIVAMNENHERVEKALSETKLDNFPEIVVLRQSDFREDLKPFCGGLQAQGRKLYISSESDKNSHGTLGCLAKLNDTETVGVSCRHVCEKDQIVYIENGENERMALGKCLYTSSGAMSLHSDFAIVDVNSKLLGYFPRKKLMDHTGEPTNAMVFSGDTMSLKDEIVHKLGASSEWTQGKVVCTEITEKNQGIMTVRGMNGQVFGKRGDSGSIVFREMFNAREQRLEVVALLTSGEYEQRDITDKESVEEQSQTLIICSVFETALEQLRTNNTHIQSFEFFSD